MSTSAQLYTHAKKDLGLRETHGSISTPRIKQAIKMAAGWLDLDDSVTPWCGCIRGLWGYETGTGCPKEFYRARNWLNWGQRVPTLEDAITGDTVVMKRDGGYHVGLFAAIVNKDEFTMLGGNQSNQVSIARQPRSLIVGIRR